MTWRCLRGHVRVSCRQQEPPALHATQPAFYASRTEEKSKGALVATSNCGPGISFILAKDGSRALTSREADAGDEKKSSEVGKALNTLPSLLNSVSSLSKCSGASRCRKIVAVFLHVLVEAHSYPC